MKKIQIMAMAACFTVLCACCKSGNKNESKASDGAETKNETPQPAEDAIGNAGRAKRTLTFTINGQAFAANENTVQCMFIGMGSGSMAQGMISGSGNGISVSGVMMTRPQTGELKSEGPGSTVGITIIKDGVEYQSMPAGKLSIHITKIQPDGNNYYIGGTFSGAFKSKDGKSIVITDGAFESAYL
jgi:hypothetical protein